jgi:hypothetical protein
VLTVVANKDTPLRFDLDITYFISESREHKASFEALQGGFFFIPNPFEHKWSVDLVCNANWEETSKIILETRVSDAEREDPIFNKFTFLPESTELQLTIAGSVDTPKEKFEYRVTRLTREMEIIQGPWKVHEGSVLVFNDRISSERIIRAIITRAPDFEKKEITKVSVEFKYTDRDSNIDIESDRIYFEHADDVVEFKHPMPDFSKKEYEYRVRVRGISGESFKSDWISAESDKLELVIQDDIW